MKSSETVAKQRFGIMDILVFLHRPVGKKKQGLIRQMSETDEEM